MKTVVFEYTVPFSCTDGLEIKNQICECVSTFVVSCCTEILTMLNDDADKICFKIDMTKKKRRESIALCLVPLEALRIALLTSELVML